VKLVLDANVGLKFVLDENQSDKARQLREEFRKGLHELIAPDVYPIEVAHALTRVERRREITHGQASGLLLDVLNTSPRLFRSLPYLSRAVELSSQARMGVYDCLYVALAEAENCDFVTADERIQKALPTAPVKLLGQLF
jgi:predicted nucleic acid-binding protein